MTASLDHSSIALIRGRSRPSQHFVPHIFFGLDPMMVSTVILCTTCVTRKLCARRLGASVMVIGASANLTVAGIAERNGVPFRFMTYAFYGMPMMIVSIAIAHLYVWWRYF